MNYRITGLAAAPFQYLFGLSEAQLAAHGAVRYAVDAPNSFPDRIEMRDCVPGESVLLVNFTSQPAATPYRATHAIFVREGAGAAYDRVNEIPEVMRRRLLSLRGFDEGGMMVVADVVEGSAVEPVIGRFFADPKVKSIHVHNARQGCYSGLIERA